MKKKTVQRTLVPITPELHPRTHRNIWYAIGAAIILISVIIAIILGAWSVQFPQQQ